MVLIETNFGSFDDYLKSLTKGARKNYTYVKNANLNLEYREVDFVEDEVHRFMGLWERQLIRGQRVVWAFPVGHVRGLWEKGELKVFKGGEETLHFIQKRDGFWECHPPIWNKEKYKDRNQGTWMWFKLVEYAIKNKLGILDLGGGIDESWREMIKRRGEFSNPHYKWRFVPANVKNNPDKQNDYSIQGLYEQRFLCENKGG